MPFYKILVPTVDTIRNSYLVNALVKANKHVLLVGNTGTGTTSTVRGTLTNPPEGFSALTINFSAQTSSNRVQEIIESNVEKRTKDVYVPQGGKKMIVFVDDLNMPAKDQYGSQPPLELLRQWIDYGFWYDREKQTTNYIKDMQFVCAMGPPGGGRSVISHRLLSRFNVINVTFPS
jgi:dynein heavy chain